MAITVADFTTFGPLSTSTSFALPNPAGTAHGDVLVALVRYTASASFATWPAGWALVGRNRTSTTATHAAADLYVYPWDSGDPTSHTVAFGTSTTYAGGVVAFRGVDATTPQDAAGQTVQGNLVTSVTVPAITTVTADAVLVSGAGLVGGTDFLTHPSGMTELWDSGVDAFAYAVAPSPGSSGTKVWAVTSAINRRVVGILGALRPGAAPAGTPPRTQVVLAG